MFSIVQSGILAAAIGVINEPTARPLPLHCHQQSPKREFGAHVVAHRPADDFSGVQVEGFPAVIAKHNSRTARR